MHDTHASSLTFAFLLQSMHRVFIYLMPCIYISSCLLYFSLNKRSFALESTINAFRRFDVSNVGIGIAIDIGIGICHVYKFHCDL